MARIRTIKPEFWTDEDLALLDPRTQLLAIGLLNHSDDEGYFKAHPLIIKATIFPFSEDSVSIHDMLKQLENVGYLVLFKGTDGKAYGIVSNFLEHQRINRPTPSKIKELQLLSEDSVSGQGDITEDSPPERKGKERKGSTSDDVLSVFSYWQTTMSKPLAKLDSSRRSKIQSRLQNFSTDQLKKAIDGCAASPYHMGQNDNNKIYNTIDLIFRTDSKTEEFMDGTTQSVQGGGFEV
jgi:hypothetical protein